MARFGIMRGNAQNMTCHISAMSHTHSFLPTPMNHTPSPLLPPLHLLPPLPTTRPTSPDNHTGHGRATRGMGGRAGTPRHHAGRWAAHRRGGQASGDPHDHHVTTPGDQPVTRGTGEPARMATMATSPRRTSAGKHPPLGTASPHPR